MQWGQKATQSSATITFPIAFSQSIYSVVTTAYGLNTSADNVNAYAGVTSYTLNGFSFIAAKNASGRMWLAVGK